MAKFRPLTTVNEQVVHQMPGEQPQATVTLFSRALESEEQPYGPRKMTVGAAWVPLDHGWVERAGQVVIENVEGKRLQLVPTQDERAAVDAMVTEFGVERKDGVIELVGFVPPRGESARWFPADVSKVRLRCLAGDCKITVTVHPR